MIRQSILDRLVIKRSLPVTAFDTTHPNEFITQSFESVRLGQSDYNRQLNVYYFNNDCIDSSNKRNFFNYINTQE